MTIIQSISSPITGLGRTTTNSIMEPADILMENLMAYWSIFDGRLETNKKSLQNRHREMFEKVFHPDWILAATIPITKEEINTNDSCIQDNNNNDKHQHQHNNCIIMDRETMFERLLHFLEHQIVVEKMTVKKLDPVRVEYKLFLMVSTINNNNDNNNNNSKDQEEVKPITSIGIASNNGQLYQTQPEDVLTRFHKDVQFIEKTASSSSSSSTITNDRGTTFTTSSPNDKKMVSLKESSPSLSSSLTKWTRRTSPADMMLKRLTSYFDSFDGNQKSPLEMKIAMMEVFHPDCTMMDYSKQHKASITDYNIVKVEQVVKLQTLDASRVEWVFDVTKADGTRMEIHSIGIANNHNGKVLYMVPLYGSDNNNGHDKNTTSTATTVEQTIALQPIGTSPTTGKRVLQKRTTRKITKKTTTRKTTTTTKMIRAN